MNIVSGIKSKTRQKLKYAWNDLTGMIGLNEQLFQKARGARIVVYHGICRKDHTRFNSIFLRLKTFEAHLQFYRKYFHIISLDDFYNNRFSKERFNICISFDDGFANNYKYVLPLINEYQVPVTFFITGIREAGYDILWNDFLCLAQKYGPPKLRFLNEQYYKDKYGRYISTRTKNSLKDILMKDSFTEKAELIKALEPIIQEHKKKEEDYWLQMTMEEINELSISPFAIIGSHGYYHNDLSKISIADATNEMAHSKQWLERLTGKIINSIAFPYGGYTSDVVIKAKQAGFTQLLATDFLFPEDHTDAAMRERLTINPYISVNNQMIAIINGKYE